MYSTEHDKRFWWNNFDNDLYQRILEYRKI
jgi:hypothetical protein